MSQEQLDHDESHIKLRLQMARAIMHPADRHAFGSGVRDGNDLVGNDGSRLRYCNGLVFYEKPEDDIPDHSELGQGDA